MRGIIGLLVFGLCLAAGGARATEADNYCPSGTTSTGAIIWSPCGGTGGVPFIITSPPYVATFLGKHSLSAATLATSTALTPPAGATIANFFPECATNGTDNQCVRFNPNGTADASASAGLGSQQLYLGETAASFAAYQVILAVGATGASGTISTLTVYYYK